MNEYKNILTGDAAVAWKRITSRFNWSTDNKILEHLIEVHERFCGELCPLLRSEVKEEIDSGNSGNAFNDEENKDGCLMSTVDNHMTTVDNHLSTVDNHMSTVDNHMSTVDNHMSTIDNHMSTVDNHLSTVDNHMSTVDNHLSTVDNHMSTVDNHMSTENEENDMTLNLEVEDGAESIDDDSSGESDSDTESGECDTIKFEYTEQSDDSRIAEDISKPAITHLPQPETPAFPQIKTNRFKQSTEEEVNKLFEARQTKGTKKNTTWGWKIIQAWSLERRGEPVDFETISPNQLNKLLEKFYCEARPGKIGELYQKNTLKNLRGAINRKLADLKRNIDIVKDKEFKTSNGVLEGLLKERFRDGKSEFTQHNDLIKRSDMEKISKYFSDAPFNSVILRQCVYFHLAVHFISRAQVFHYQLKLNSFTFHTDDTGEYVTLSYLPKNSHKAGITNAEMNTEKRMYATGTRTCPVKMLKLLIDKTDESASSLFNKYRKESLSLPKSTKKWYMDAPLQRRTFSNFMKDISKAAGLSRLYTGHCLRATTIQHLISEGYEAKHIMYLSDHKTEGSLQSFNGEVSSSEKKNLSCTLSKIMNPSTDEQRGTSLFNFAQPRELSYVAEDAGVSVSNTAIPGFSTQPWP